MATTPALLPDLIQAACNAIEDHAEEVTKLDQAIGDGDHVTNLQRGLQALGEQGGELAQLEWAEALQRIGMTILSRVGGASGSLYGTLFMAMSKALKGRPSDFAAFAGAFAAGVEAMKRRGRSDVGEKTMLDTLVPVAEFLNQAAREGMAREAILKGVREVATAGMESTRDLPATKGRASYLGERSRGIVDAGARTAQLMICAIADTLEGQD